MHEKSSVKKKWKIESIFSEIWVVEREEVIHYNQSVISALENHANLEDNFLNAQIAVRGITTVAALQC